MTKRKRQRHHMRTGRKKMKTQNKLRMNSRNCAKSKRKVILGKARELVGEMMGHPHHDHWSLSATVSPSHQHPPVLRQWRHPMPRVFGRNRRRGGLGGWRNGSGRTTLESAADSVGVPEGICFGKLEMWWRWEGRNGETEAPGGGGTSPVPPPMTRVVGDSVGEQENMVTEHAFFADADGPCGEFSYQRGNGLTGQALCATNSFGGAATTRAKSAVAWTNTRAIQSLCGGSSVGIAKRV